jgi:hypothetical protein
LISRADAKKAKFKAEQEAVKKSVNSAQDLICGATAAARESIYQCLNNADFLSGYLKTRQFQLTFRLKKLL